MSKEKWDEFSIVGKNMPRVDGLDKALGVAKYVSDISVPGMLVGKILRSPFPHARIMNIDTSRALNKAGVKAVITAADTARRKFCMNRGWESNMILQDSKVRFIGDQVAAVAAIDEDTAMEALSLIKAEYEPLPAVFDPEEAMLHGAPEIHEAKNNIAIHVQRMFGDVEKGFEQSHLIRQGFYYSPPVTHCCMEPRACFATYSSDTLSIWAHTQTPHGLREELSEAIQIPQSKISVFQAPIGGAFGAKIGMDPMDAITALLAMKTRLPVKIANKRDEEFATSRFRYPMKIWLRSGVKKDGRIIARDVKVITDNGAYNHEGHLVMGNAGSKAAQLYAVPNVRYEGYLVFTNNVFGGAFRGFGNPQITFAMETQLDEIADCLNMDPADIRRVNANTPNSTTASGCKITSCGLTECIEITARESNWINKRKRPKSKKNARVGIGMACMIHGGSGVKFYYGKNCNFSSAIIKMNNDGSVDLLVGASELGQGSDTTMAMLAAERLGINLSDIKVISGDTDTTPFDPGAWGSRQTFTAGNAVLSAANKVRRQLLDVASDLMEANIEDLDIKNGNISVKGSPSISIRVSDAAAESYRNRGKPIQAQGVFEDVWSVQSDPKTGIGNVSSAYSFGTQVAEVEVDIETGFVKVLDFWCAHDVGRAINPLGAETQIEGGVLSMGIGYALMEKMIFQSGEVKNQSFCDYKIPTISDACGLKNYFVETLDEHGPLGAKGVGEPAMIPSAAAIANAIYDAVGVWVRELPITPDRLLSAIKENSIKRNGR